MSRGRAWRRHQTERVVEKRLQIIKIWCSGSSEIGAHSSFTSSPEFKKPGILKKWNLTCGCGMCKMDREKGYYNDKEEKKSVSVDQEYGDWWDSANYGELCAID